MKAISLWQPWASLIAIGAKPFETRDWAPPKSLIGQRIAIHAAKKPVAPIARTLDDETHASISRALGVAWLPDAKLPLGAIVCTAVLTEVAQVDDRECFQFPSSPDVFSFPDAFGNYSSGRWIWRFERVRPIEHPIPIRGSQGFFEIYQTIEVVSVDGRPPPHPLGPGHTCTPLHGGWSCLGCEPCQEEGRKRFMGATPPQIEVPPGLTLPEILDSLKRPEEEVSGDGK